MLLLGLGLDCPCSVIWQVPVQHFEAAILDAWRNKVAADLCSRRAFEVGLCWMSMGSLQLLYSSHVRERDKALLRSIMVGVSGMISFLVGFVIRLFLVGFAVLQMVMDTFLGMYLSSSC